DLTIAEVEIYHLALPSDTNINVVLHVSMLRLPSKSLSGSIVIELRCALDIR
ncbi:hypothetical protein ACLOJK_030936, partial [Asimina triloba]